MCKHTNTQNKFKQNNGKRLTYYIINYMYTFIFEIYVLIHFGLSIDLAQICLWKKKYMMSL